MADKINENEADPALQEGEYAAEEATTSDTWESELPPEDDFHDADDAASVMGDDGLAEEPASDEAYEANLLEEKKKRGKTILFIAMVAGVVLIGLLAYLQFGTDDEPSTIAYPAAAVMNVSNLGETTKVTATTPEATVSVETNEKTGRVDLDALYQKGQERSGTKVALPGAPPAELVTEKPIADSSTGIISSSSDTAIMPPPVATPTAATAALPPVNVNQPLPPASATPTAKVQPEAAKPLSVALGGMDPAVKAASVQPQAQAQPESAEMEARLKAVTDQMESLQRSLDEAMAQNANLMAQIETLQKEKAAMLEKKEEPVVRVEKKEKPARAAKPAEDVGLYMDALMDHPAVAPDAPVAKKASVKKADKKRETSSSKKATAKKDSGWVLRAATPDAAWISAGRESQELRRVAVGESIPGLGKVKEIRQEGDKWAVVGENGSLR